MPNESKYPIVKITWNDASSDDNEWKHEEDLDDNDELVTTIGYLVKETKNFVWIASSTYERYNNNRTKIPKLMVMSKEVLQEGKEQ